MMNSLGSILDRRAFESPLIKGVVAAQTVEAGNAALRELFGAEINKHANAAYLKKDSLYVACLSSTVAQEIKLHEARLLELIRKSAPQAKLLYIKCIS